MFFIINPDEDLIVEYVHKKFDRQDNSVGRKSTEEEFNSKGEDYGDFDVAKVFIYPQCESTSGGYAQAINPNTRYTILHF